MPRLTPDLAEHLLLDRHVLVHRLDHEVGRRAALVARDAPDPREPLRRRGGRQASPVHRRLIAALDGGEAARERIRAAVAQAHAQAGVGARHRDRRAHRARPQDRHLLPAGAPLPASPGSLPALRSARNPWSIARACSDRTQPSASARSVRQPRRRGRRRGRDRLDRRDGAVCGRASLPPARERGEERPFAGVASFSVRSRVRGWGGRADAASRANTPRVRWRRVGTASNPALQASSAPIDAAHHHIERFAMPTGESARSFPPRLE